MYSTDGDSNTGGCIMLIIGVLYLAFESRILAISQTGTTQDTKSHNFARGLIGVQIGLIALAMIVTTSSVASLQAKEGLPLGTQMTGWLVLSMVLAHDITWTSLTKHSRLFALARRTRSAR